MEFTVTNAAFAAYLVASKKLNLLRLEVLTPQIARLVFDDPENAGVALELDFLSGTAMVPATTYHHALRSVRRSIEIKLAEARRLASTKSVAGGGAG